MNNFVDYFYDIKVDKLEFCDDYYSFIFRNNYYKLYLINDYININNVVNINNYLVNNTLVSKIIKNKDGKYVSSYNNQNFILIEIYVNIHKKITLDEISYIDNSLYKNDKKIDWGMLWSKKIDYLEEVINENGKKYPLIVDSFNYFVGMAENAISYFNSIMIPNNYYLTISHKEIRINDTIEVLYNPLNIIFDYRVRDIAEYIKNAFFLNNNIDNNIDNELDIYLKNNNLNIIDIKLLIARLLYPSFYFELYEDILIKNKSENIIVGIVNKLPEYEKYLDNIINYFSNYYEIDSIRWLKNTYNIQNKNED